MDIYRKFTAALESLGVRGGVIVAFSGGADSTCLLSLFCTAAARGDFPYPLAAAHLNHGLRGEEAAREALRLAAHKLPIKTKIIKREEEKMGGEEQ